MNLIGEQADGVGILTNILINIGITIIL